MLFNIITLMLFYGQIAQEEEVKIFAVSVLLFFMAIAVIAATVKPLRERALSEMEEEEEVKSKKQKYIARVTIVLLIASLLAFGYWWVSVLFVAMDIASVIMKNNYNKGKKRKRR